jgi:hypothetical protein
MSAPPAEADIDRRLSHVGFGPIPEVAKVPVATCASLHVPAHAVTGGFPAYGFAFANPSDDAVSFFDAATAVHENFGA